jgi:hypothetical protein
LIFLFIFIFILRSKRASTITAGIQQLQFVWYTARYLVLPPAQRTDKEFAVIVDLHSRIVEQLPKNMHFISLEALQSKLETTLSAGEAKESVISLESVGDALTEDALEEDWLHTVMRLLMGSPAQLQMPLDRNGQPDFMDAWSAVSERIGVDVMTSADFQLLVGSCWRHQNKVSHKNTLYVPNRKITKV